MSATDFFENVIANHFFGNTPATVPGTYYLALHTSAPGENGASGEVSGGSYVRKSITNNTTQFPNASGGVKSNGAAITFVVPTADWGNVGWWSLWDASSGGNCYVVSDGFTAVAVNTGVTVTFDPSTMSITVT